MALLKDWMLDRWYNGQRPLFCRYLEMVSIWRDDARAHVAIESTSYFGTAEEDLSRLIWERLLGKLTTDKTLLSIFDLGKLQAALREAVVKRVTAETSYIKAFNEVIGTTLDQPLSDEVNGIPHYQRVYPEFYRRLEAALVSWVDAVFEALMRISGDWVLISERFRIKAKIVNGFYFEAGDTHAFGRSVFVLAAGDEKFVYRPRSVGCYKFVKAALDILQQDDRDGLVTVPQCIDRGDYGYTSYIAHERNISLHDVQTYFVSVGKLIGISYLLGIGDLHYQNIVARRGEVGLIDCEVVFHRTFADPQSSCGREPYRFASQDASHDLLFGSQLLPSRMKGHTRTFDLSGLGAFGAQSFSFAQDGTLEDFSEECVSVIHPTENVAYLDDTPICPSDYRSQILDGLNIISNKSLRRDIQAALTNLVDISEFDTRVVLRPTSFYERIIDTLRRPLFSANRLAADMYVGACLGANSEHANYLIMRGEYSSLIAGDIPLFSGRSSDQSLYCQGEEIKPRFFAAKPSVEFRRRLSRMFELKGAQGNSLFGALATIPREQSDDKRYNDRHLCSDVRPTGHFDMAKQLADTIHKQVCMSDGIPFIASLSPIDGQEVTCAKASPVLYNGLPGIALFASRIHSATNLYIEFIEGTLKLIRLEMKSNMNKVPGAFSGYAGNIYAVWHILKALKRSIVPDIVAGLCFLGEKIADDSHLDIISGVAGALAVCTRLAQEDVARAEASLIALNCVKRLHETARFCEGKAAWPTLKDKNQLVSGFAHGAAGIAWALGEWAAFANDEEAAKLARAALSFEMQFYHGPTSTWRAPGSDSMDAWCYGAPGVALAAHRLARIGIVEAQGWVDSVAIRLGRDDIRHDDCLCHGNAGIVSILYELGCGREATNLKDKFTARAMLQGRWDSDPRSNFVNPGLMDGRAGIGLALLGQSDPKPSVLLLEAPL